MPAAARLGDACIPHCSPFVVASGSTDVLVNGRPFARVGDKVSPHKFPARRCPPHAPVIITGSFSVIVNGRPAATLGSKIVACTAVAQGSFDVIVG